MKIRVVRRTDEGRELAVVIECDHYLVEHGVLLFYLNRWDDRPFRVERAYDYAHVVDPESAQLERGNS